MKNIVLVGAGGHAKSCIDIIEDTNKFKIKYLLRKKYSTINVKNGARVPKNVALAILVIFTASKNNAK